MLSDTIILMGCSILDTGQQAGTNYGGFYESSRLSRSTSRGYRLIKLLCILNVMSRLHLLTAINLVFPFFLLFILNFLLTM